MKFRTYYNSKSVKLVQAIIETENLDVTCKTEIDAIGDTMIVATGSKAAIQTLKSIYDMVS